MPWCIPEAVGVPGLFGQPPTWQPIAALNGHTAWSTTNSVSTPLGLDDPRWQGHLSIGFPSVTAAPTSCCGGSAATSQTFGAATNDDVVFRALYDSVGAGRFLYLSWWVKAADVNSLLDDAIHVGFTRASGDPFVLRIIPSTSPATVSAAPVGPVTVSTVPAGGGPVGTWTENGGATPSWIAANTHVWVDSVSHRWAVQMRVPIGDSNVDTQLNLADTFKMWFEVSIELPGNLMAPYSWPRDVCVVDFCGLPSRMNVPDPADWGDFHLSTGPGDPACTATGFVRLTVADVGTQNAPTSKINLVSDNTFEAKPENLTGATVNPGEIHAEFRLANWGSVADPNAPWSPIPATGGSTNPASNTGSIANATKGLITMKWQLSNAERDQFAPGGPKSRHQCILVTLSGAHAFNPASVWRNMDFVSASTMLRAATISNVGLGPSPVPGNPRPAYILVEKLNMPPTVSGGSQDRPPDATERAADGHGTGHGNGEQDPTELLAEAAKQLGDPNDRLEQQPTIRYHAYHDTGLDVNRDGRTRRVVRPGTAFGFFVDHEGDLGGWHDEIRGATQLTERFFSLEVPEEGTAQITTVVEALEPGRPGCLGAIWRFIESILKRITGLFGP
ncbi:hypothetical protein RAJCM14343_1489 [Rhodococcus aetherivorans]|uniref:Uncharacterized protein n=1 Tax=Rhodococcus aetherivorans TaxID=191292 RepID=A0ABQ0YI81_9NOCA|nr:hypothetical protein [Rhodococcus aetherivorans]ETT24117.1 hypothetical protein RR21198_0304 [Rhodococcus rhodochrous ATCC 21198]NGP26670.1 hypothetical protein [Rhodococcus aetherivorans]GES36238.1 hypothetical protein RAJCM14343_1489 [Rhodococcus aetherivorans]